MISLLIDFGGAYLVAQRVKSIWLALILAVLVGWAATLIGNLLIFFWLADEIAKGELGIRIVQGIVLHPLVAIGATIFFRRKRRKEVNAPVEPVYKDAPASESSEEPLSAFVACVENWPDDSEVRDSAQALLTDGYDLEGLVEIVRDRLGSSHAFRLEKVISS